MKIIDRRRYGNNPYGNPNIAEEGYKWRQSHPNWRVYLTQISKERSTGAKSHWGKLKVSMNARKYFGAGGRFSNGSLFIKSIKDGYFLSIAQTLGNERMEEIIKGLINKL